MPPQPIHLLRDTSPADEVSYRNIREFEDVIAGDPEVVAESLARWQVALVRWTRGAWRALRMPPRRNGAYELGGARDEGYNLAILLGPSFHRCAGFFRTGRKAAYLFDATEPWASPAAVARFVKETGITDLFVDHPEFVDPIARLTADCRIHFVAHGIDPRIYHSAEVKDIDVMEFGRKMPGYHESLKRGLPPLGISFQFDFIGTRAGFIDALARAKISVSFPRSMTDGSPVLPMLTPRYLQSIASRSLVVGSAPPLLVELFGYNPVIEADLVDPCGQIARILRDYDRYQDLLERNYKTLVESHTFRHRWDQMKRILQSLPESLT